MKTLAILLLLIPANIANSFIVIDPPPSPIEIDFQSGLYAYLIPKWEPPHDKTNNNLRYHQPRRNQREQSHRRAGRKDTRSLSQSKQHHGKRNHLSYYSLTVRRGTR